MMVIVNQQARQSGRDAGRTTEQLSAALATVLSGTNVAYICRNQLAARYTQDLLLHILENCNSHITTDKIRRNPTRVIFNSDMITFYSARRTPHCLTGFSGKVIFDHAAFRAARYPSAHEQRCRDCADACNLRIEEIRAAKPRN